jgi:hypothetical protein
MISASGEASPICDAISSATLSAAARSTASAWWVYLAVIVLPRWPISAPMVDSLKKVRCDAGERVPQDVGRDVGRQRGGLYHPREQAREARHALGGAAGARENTTFPGDAGQVAEQVACGAGQRAEAGAGLGVRQLGRAAGEVDLRLA